MSSVFGPAGVGGSGARPPHPLIRIAESPASITAKLRHQREPRTTVVSEGARRIATARSKTCVEAALPSLCRNLPDCGKVLGVPPPSLRCGKAAGGAELRRPDNCHARPSRKTKPKRWQATALQ